MYDQTKQQYFVAEVNVDTTINGADCYIDENGVIESRTNEKLGEVLFYTDSTPYGNTDFSTVYTDQTNLVYQKARNGWRRLEGIQNGKLLMPETASASISDGKMTIKITPQTLPGSTALCDPFMYEIEISQGSTTKTYKLYMEEGSFTLPGGFSDQASIQVRAVSMYEDVDPSDWLELDKQNINRILPEPDIRVTLVENGNAPYTAASQYIYQFSLNNLEAYEAQDEDGNDLYPNWQVNINIPRAGNVVLTKKQPVSGLTVKSSGNTVYQMMAQAKAISDGTVLIQDSGQISVPLSLPVYQPPIALNGNGALTVKTELSGTTQEDLAVTVTLDANQTTMTTPPIYRAELVGTWNDVEDTIFAKTDLLLVSAGTVSGTFSNLPEYIKDATDLRIRIWYAASGLGPVYTWQDLDTDGDEANLKELVSVNVDENGAATEQWSYGHSSVLSSTESGHYFGNYRYDGETLFTWLPAPELENTGDMPEPDEEQLKDGKIVYTFTWDTDASDTENANYAVSMTGLDENGNQVLIDLGNAYQEGEKSLTVDASDWNYQSVELKVTRIGNAAEKKIGLSSTGTYPLKQRLAQPGQPSMENMDVNELDYQLTWAAIDDETGCSGYQAYIRAYDENGQLGEAKALFAEPIALSRKTDGTYQERLTLDEKWAGQKVVIYLVALADDSGKYLDSADGIRDEMTIPERLTISDITWTTGWKSGKEGAVIAEEFRNGLQVSLTGDTPPGGSAYLLKGYIYDSAEDAQAALDAKDPTKGALAAYPAADDIQNVVPVQMDGSSSGYAHTMSGLSIEYAGKYMVFYTRISSGSSSMLSSVWAASEAFELPYVQLDAPKVSSGETERKITATVKGSKNPDLADQEVEQEWTAVNTVLTWTEVDCADAYEVTLTDTEGTEVTCILKKTDHGMETDPSLEEYAITIEDGSYIDKNQTKLTYSLTVKAELETETLEDGTVQYTLILPDMQQLTAADQESVTHDAFKKTVKAVLKAEVTAENQSYVTSEETTVSWD